MGKFMAIKSKCYFVISLKIADFHLKQLIDQVATCLEMSLVGVW